METPFPAQAEGAGKGWFPAYLQGMETTSPLIASKASITGSQPTYKGWKLWFVDGEEEAGEKFPAYLQGMETE